MSKQPGDSGNTLAAGSAAVRSCPAQAVQLLPILLISSKELYFLNLL
jgi:hypothetical protein